MEHGDSNKISDSTLNLICSVFIWLAFVSDASSMLTTVGWVVACGSPWSMHVRSCCQGG